MPELVNDDAITTNDQQEDNNDENNIVLEISPLPLDQETSEISGSESATTPVAFNEVQSPASSSQTPSKVALRNLLYRRPSRSRKRNIHHRHRSSRTRDTSRNSNSIRSSSWSGGGGRNDSETTSNSPRPNNRSMMYETATSFNQVRQSQSYIDEPFYTDPNAQSSVNYNVTSTESRLQEFGIGLRPLRVPDDDDDNSPVRRERTSERADEETSKGVFSKSPRSVVSGSYREANSSPVQPQQSATTFEYDLHRRRAGILSFKCFPRIQMWRGRILNSYFAKRLFLLSLMIVSLSVFGLLVRYLSDVEGREEDMKRCTSIEKTSALIHNIGLVNILLGFPAFFPHGFKLYRLERQRIIRSPFLHLCEVLIIAEVVLMGLYILFMLIWLLGVSGYGITKCLSTGEFYRYVQVGLGLVVWLLLYFQITTFSRFRSHAKLQLASLDDSGHSSNIKGWFKTLISTTSFSKRGKRINGIRKKLYKAVRRRDTEAVASIIADATEYVGDSFATKIYKCPRIWFLISVRSQKNPLHAACAIGDVQLVSTLLDAGFDPNELDRVSRVNFSVSQLFKFTQIFVRTQDRLRWSLHSIFSPLLVSPLHVSVVNGHEKIVSLLLAREAKVDVVAKSSIFLNTGNATPLFVAQHPHIMEILLKAGANPLLLPSARGSGETITAQQRHIMQGRFATESVLAAWGGDVALTPLHSAAAIGDDDAVANYLKEGADVGSLGECVDGTSLRTPLHWASIAGKVGAVELLLEYGSDPNAVDRFGRSPLHWAVQNNHVGVVQLLLGSGADANLRDVDDYPPICVAAEQEVVDERIFMLLVAHNADIHAAVSSGNTALHLALLKENRETGISLLKYGADILKKNLVGQRALDCTTSTEILFAVKRQAGQRDIMISYSHAHSDLAIKVREAVEGKGITCWMDLMDPNGIAGGSIWREEIALGIKRACAVLAIVSGKYGYSNWCLKELAYAKIVDRTVIGLIAESEAITSEIQHYIPESNRIDLTNSIIGQHLERNRSVVYEYESEAFDGAIDKTITQIREIIAEARIAGLVQPRHSGRLSSSFLDLHRKSASDSMFVSLYHAQKVVEDDEMMIPPQHPFVKTICYNLEKQGIRHVLLEEKNDDAENEEAATTALRCNISESAALLIVLTKDAASNETLVKCLKYANENHTKIFFLYYSEAFMSEGQIYTLSRSKVHYYVNGSGFHRFIRDLLPHLSYESMNNNSSFLEKRLTETSFRATIEGEKGGSTTRDSFASSTASFANNSQVSSSSNLDIKVL